MKKILLVAISLMVIFSGCKKEEGLDGTNGTNGKDGADGNANVKSLNITINPSDWQAVGNSGEADFKYVASYDTDLITKDIADNGVVLVFYYNDGANFQLPIVITYDGYTRYFNFMYGEGGIAITSKDSDLLSVKPTADIDFRIVIIEGSALATKSNVNLSDYNEVKKAFNLE